MQDCTCPRGRWQIVWQCDRPSHGVHTFRGAPPRRRSVPVNRSAVVAILCGGPCRWPPGVLETFPCVRPRTLTARGYCWLCRFRRAWTGELAPNPPFPSSRADEMSAANRIVSRDLYSGQDACFEDAKISRPRARSAARRRSRLGRAEGEGSLALLALRARPGSGSGPLWSPLRPRSGRCTARISACGDAGGPALPRRVVARSTSRFGRNVRG